MGIHGGEKMINKNSDVCGLSMTHYLGRSFISIALLFFLTTCLTATANKSEPIEQKEIATNTVENQKSEVMPHKPAEPVLKPALEKPDFIPITEELSPLKTQIVSISARNTPLGDVLLVIADSAKLNLVLEKGVNPETLITLTLNKVSVEDALDTIFTSVDYFYSVKGNMLRVKAMDTRIFEFGQPSILQEYLVEVGGDILGGAIATVETLGTAGSTASELKGSVIQKIKADENSFTKFWDSVEETIKNLIGASIERRATTEDIKLQPKFTINQLTGTIVVTATKNDLEKVNRYLTSLKNILNRQVLIEVRIVEVQLTEAMKYGIDWTFLDNWAGMGTISLGTEDFSGVVGTTESRLQFTVTGSDFTSLLHALQQQGEVRTLSNPRINIMNTQTAVLSVGRTQSFISKVETTTSSGTTPTTTTFTVDTSSVLSGIIIGIVPYIDEKGATTLTITPIISDLHQLVDKTVGVVGANTIEISLPTVDLRELSTTIKLKNNEMVIIGGLITKEDREDDYEVPVLAKIPLLGNLFKRHSKTEENTELIIMLKPTVSTTN